MKPKRFISGIIPTNKCNLKCPYCYISHLPDYMKMEQSFKYSPEHIANCLRPERFGGICLINLTGEGETFLQPDLVTLCRLLLEQGHFLEVVTNLTVKKTVIDFLEFPENLQRRLEFKVSFHYKELLRRNLLNVFTENLELIQKSSFSFSLELMSDDSQIDDIPDIIEFSNNVVGANCHVTVGRNEKYNDKRLLTSLPKEDYIASWEQFHSTMFDYKIELLGVKRHEFCYAGDWTLFVNMHTGEARSCYAQPDTQNIFESPDKPIRFHAVGRHCVQPYCFNGHAFLSLGAVPSLDSPTFFDIRNRTRADGSNWFSDEAKEFFSSKLIESNREYSGLKKALNFFGWYFRAVIFSLSKPKTVIRFFKLSINRLLKKHH